MSEFGEHPPDRMMSIAMLIAFVLILYLYMISR